MNSKQCSDQLHLFATTEPLLIRALCLGETNSSVYFCREGYPDEIAALQLEHIHYSLSKDWGNDELSMPFVLASVVITPKSVNKPIITLFSDDDTKVSFQSASLIQRPQPTDLPPWLLDQIVIVANGSPDAEHAHKTSYQHLIDSYLNNPNALDGEGIFSAPSIQRIAQTLLTLNRLHRYNGVNDAFDEHFRDVLDLITLYCDNYRSYDITQEELHNELRALRGLLV
ncbi:hypothetical protein ACSLBF_09580 [Pseudoalteromonas sp. T1lg65]|uniref:hypothetical protein n=1 Tax=Pseudoalteromonas sp. T1lg65 TaxID=2077101 RepID=UPI003F79EF31